MKRFQVVALLVTIALITAGAQAAFIVEPLGLASANSDSDGTVASLAGGAPGLTGVSSVYRHGDNTLITSTYTPGVDVDNYATAVPGGGSGQYNVYATWPASTNVSGGPAIVTVTHDGGSTVWSGDQNTGSGGTDAWQLVAGNVMLTAGNPYTASIQGTNGTWVSFRTSGMMWEAVPEPATMVLLGLGGLLVRSRRRR